MCFDTDKENGHISGKELVLLVVKYIVRRLQILLICIFMNSSPEDEVFFFLLQIFLHHGP